MKEFFFSKQGYYSSMHYTVNPEVSENLIAETFGIL